MKGEPINISNIEKKVKEGFNEISDKFSKEYLVILGVTKSIRLKVDDGMKKYLKHHRNRFNIK